MQAKIAGLVGISGTIFPSSTIWVLQYAKRDSLRLLPWIYYHPDLPCLERKRVQFHDYLAKAGLTA
jgi:hypothetical protein